MPPTGQDPRVRKAIRWHSTEEIDPDRIGWDLEQGPVYPADLEAGPYRVDMLRERFRIIPERPLFRLEKP